MCYQVSYFTVVLDTNLYFRSTLLSFIGVVFLKMYCSLFPNWTRGYFGSYTISVTGAVAFCRSRLILQNAHNWDFQTGYRSLFFLRPFFFLAHNENFPDCLHGVYVTSERWTFLITHTVSNGCRNLGPFRPICMNPFFTGPSLVTVVV